LRGAPGCLGKTLAAEISDRILLSKPQPQSLGMGNELPSTLAMNQGGSSNPGQANGPSNPSPSNPGQSDEDEQSGSEFNCEKYEDYISENLHLLDPKDIPEWRLQGYIDLLRDCGTGDHP
jgi:hypothetical protein